MWVVSALVIISGLIFLMGMGLPVAFAMIATGLVGLCIRVGADVALSILGENMFSIASSQTLSAVPLFVLMGMVFLKSRIGEDLFMAAQKWLGRIPGAMAAASVGACAVFGAMCGSSTATTATIGGIAAPSMIKIGYEKSLASGVVAAAGALGPVIPPSIYMIVYGVCAEESIGQLFIAAVIPGILLAFVMIVQVMIMVRMNPKIAPSPSQTTTWSEKIRVLRGLVIPIIIIFLVLGSIYLGLATPTEAAGVGVSGSILSAFLSKRLSLSEFIEAVGNTVSFSCMVMLLIIGGSLLSKLFALELIPQKLGAFIVHLPIPRLMTMFAIQLIIFLAGFVIEGCALIIILTPVFLPTIKALAFDPIVFGVSLMINLATAVITPPFAVNLYVMKGILPDVEFSEIARGALKFLLSDILVLIIVILFPQLSLWLPHMMK